MLFVGVAALATLVAMFLPTGAPREVSEPGLEPVAVPLGAQVSESRE